MEITKEHIYFHLKHLLFIAYCIICGELHLTILNNTLLNYGMGGSKRLQTYLEIRRNLNEKFSHVKLADMPSMDEFNATSLYEQTDRYTKPLIVRNVFKSAPALKKWSPMNLAENILAENFPVEVRIDPTIPSGTFAERIKSFEAGKINQVNQVFYSFIHRKQQERILQDLGENLVNEVFSKSGYDSSGLVAITINIYRVSSHIASGVAWHTHLIEAPTTIQIKGRKHWRLAPPETTYLMRPNPNWIGGAVFSAYQKYSYLGDPTETIDTQIPRIKHVLNSTLELDTNPGDLLYTPCSWWHSTYNIIPPDIVETEKDDVVISVVFSFTSIGATLLKTAPAFYPLMLFCIIYLILSEIPFYIWLLFIILISTGKLVRGN